MRYGSEIADVEMIDGKLHVVDYDDGDTSQFILEELRRRQSSQNAPVPLTIAA